MEEKKNTILVDGVEKTFHIEKRNLINVKIGVRPGFILRKVGDAFMVMPTGPRMKEYKGMITLNETGKFLWERLAVGAEEAELVKDLLAEYDVTEEVAAKSVAAFVARLKELDFLA